MALSRPPCLSGRFFIGCEQSLDRPDRMCAISPDAIVITHAHPDHAFGLKQGAACPVYATVEAWHALARMPIDLRELVRPGTAFEVGAVSFKAFTVAHSVIAPAVGYRISVAEKSFFYVPDVLRIPGSMEVLDGIDLYIGDGARLEHPFVRGKGDQASGHASIHEQLTWCDDAKVRRATFTHCGTPIIKSDHAAMEAVVGSLGRALGITANVARDGEEIIVGGSRAEVGTITYPKSSQGITNLAR